MNFGQLLLLSMRTAGAQEADVEGDELGVVHSHRGQQLDGKERNGVGSCHRKKHSMILSSIYIYISMATL